MNKNLSKLFLFTLILLTFTTIYALEPNHSNVPTNEPLTASFPQPFSEKFIDALFTIEGLVNIIMFLLVALIPIFFICYTIKKKNNKKKFALALLSSIILSLDYIVLLLTGIPCISGCDGFAESFIMVFILLPLAAAIILLWIIYWVISYFKNK